MTPEEAQSVADVLVTADGGCGDCASNLGEWMAVRFPEFDWPALVGDAMERQHYPWEPAVPA